MSYSDSVSELVAYFGYDDGKDLPDAVIQFTDIVIQLTELYFCRNFSLESPR